MLVTREGVPEKMSQLTAGLTFRAGFYTRHRLGVALPVIVVVPVGHSLISADPCVVGVAVTINRSPVLFSSSVVYAPLCGCVDQTLFARPRYIEGDDGQQCQRALDKVPEIKTVKE